MASFVTAHMESKYILKITCSCKQMTVKDLDPSYV